MTSAELAKLSKARRRIAEFEAELASNRRAAELLKEAAQKGSPSTCAGRVGVRLLHLAATGCNI